jgi:hypothetical protein
MRRANLHNDGVTAQLDGQVFALDAYGHSTGGRRAAIQSTTGLSAVTRRDRDGLSASTAISSNSCM